VDEFWACGRCGKVYWIGPKSHLAIDFVTSTMQPVVAQAQHQLQRRHHQEEEEQQQQQEEEEEEQEEVLQQGGNL
jgi:ribosomal protein L12E/L44/L45/RPP1/RPP2